MYTAVYIHAGNKDNAERRGLSAERKMICFNRTHGPPAFTELLRVRLNVDVGLIKSTASEFPLDEARK